MLNGNTIVKTASNGKSASRPAPAPSHNRATFRHILLPTSLAQGERPAILLALQLAASQQARITFLHVFTLPDNDNSLHWLDGIGRLYEALPRPKLVHNSGRDAIEARRSHVKEHLKREVPEHIDESVDVRFECRVGDVAQEIARFATSSGADLVVLSSGLTGGWLPTLSARIRRILATTRKHVVVVRPDVASRAVHASAAHDPAARYAT